LSLAVPQKKARSETATPGQTLHGCYPINSATETIVDILTTPTIGIKIEETKAIPSRVRPGEHITLQVRYIVTAPDWWKEQDGQAKISAVWIISFINQPLLQLRPIERFLTTGPSSFQFDYSIPSGAGDGIYTITTVTTLVDPVKGNEATQAQAKTDFAIEAMCVSVMSYALRVRSSPSTTSQVIGIIGKGTKLTV
jgi:hypothetical protein